MEPERRPPAGISPAELLQRWLPREMARLGICAAGGLSPLVVRIQLWGQGGGSWDLSCVGGQLEVVPDGQGAAGVTLGMAVEDWVALVVGEEGPVDLSPAASSPGDLLFLDSASRQMVEQVSGACRFEVHKFNGRTWTLHAAFGQRQLDPKVEPDVVIATDAETYSAIRARTLSPPEAYLSQRITLRGDAALGMQVAMALLHKF